MSGARETILEFRRPQTSAEGPPDRLAFSALLISPNHGQVQLKLRAVLDLTIPRLRKRFG
jgi:hypothetical protein